VLCRGEGYSGRESSTIDAGTKQKQLGGGKTTTNVGESKFMGSIPEALEKEAKRRVLLVENPLRTGTKRKKKQGVSVLRECAMEGKVRVN